MAYAVAVFLGGEPRDSEFAAVDAQPRNVHGFRRCGICDLNDLLKVFVGLRLARARVSLVVLGAYGFVGGTCARLLAARGVPVLPLDKDDIDPGRSARASGPVPSWQARPPDFGASLAG